MQEVLSVDLNSRDKNKTKKKSGNQESNHCFTGGETTTLQ